MCVCVGEKQDHTSVIKKEIVMEDGLRDLSCVHQSLVVLSDYATLCYVAAVTCAYRHEFPVSKCTTECLLVNN